MEVVPSFKISKSIFYLKFFSKSIRPSFAQINSSRFEFCMNKKNVTVFWAYGSRPRMATSTGPLFARAFVVPPDRRPRPPLPRHYRCRSPSPPSSTVAPFPSPPRINEPSRRQQLLHGGSSRCCHGDFPPVIDSPAWATFAPLPSTQSSGESPWIS
jgi:hypothetical protein